MTLSKTAADAKKAWRDEERNQALFGDDDDGARREPYATGRSAATQTQADGTRSTSSASAGSSGATGTDGDKTLNRSFSGTY